MMTSGSTLDLDRLKPLEIQKTEANASFKGVFANLKRMIAERLAKLPWNNTVRGEVLDDDEIDTSMLEDYFDTVQLKVFEDMLFFGTRSITSIPISELHTTAVMPPVREDLPTHVDVNKKVTAEKLQKRMYRLYFIAELMEEVRDNIQKYPGVEASNHATNMKLAEIFLYLDADKSLRPRKVDASFSKEQQDNVISVFKDILYSLSRLRARRPTTLQLEMHGEGDDFILSIANEDLESSSKQLRALIDHIRYIDTLDISAANVREVVELLENMTGQEDKILTAHYVKKLITRYFRSSQDTNAKSA